MSLLFAKNFNNLLSKKKENNLDPSDLNECLVFSQLLRLMVEFYNQTPFYTFEVRNVLLKIGIVFSFLKGKKILLL